MKKRNQILGFTIITLLFASLFIGCLGETPAEEETKEKTKLVEIPEDWKTYESKEWGFRIRYPERCEIEEYKISKLTYKVEFKDLAGEKNTIFIVQGSIHEPWLFSLNETADIYIDAMKEIAQERNLIIKINEKKNITIDGEKAIRVTLSVESTHKIPGKVKKLEIFTIIARKGNKQYYLGFTVPTEKYETLIGVGNSMVRSFKFLSKEGGI
jgi:hypothetical protein